MKLWTESSLFIDNVLRPIGTMSISGFVSVKLSVIPILLMFDLDMPCVGACKSIPSCMWLSQFYRLSDTGSRCVFSRFVRILVSSRMVAMLLRVQL